MKNTDYSSYQDIRIEIKDKIAWVTIQRPEVLNALRSHTKKELLDFLKAADEEDNVDFQVIVLTGAGERAFCVGTDIKEMASFTSIEVEQMLWLEHRMNDAIRYCRKPVIAAIHGLALGGGGLIALMCDYSVISEASVVGFPEIKSGIPASIELAILPKIIGLARTRELIFLGGNLTAQEALQIGLINRVVPNGEVLESAKEIALKFMELSPTALRLQKDLINKWIETDFVAAVETSIYAASLAFTTDEPKAAIAKLLDKSRHRKQ